MLLASRASIILLIVIILYLISSQVRKGKLPLLAGMLLMIIFTLAILFASLRIARVKELAEKFKIAADLPVRDWKNFDQRTREWFTGIQLIRDNPVFGTGLGRFEEKMVEKYKQYGFTEEAKLRMNAHNQFIEAQATFGITGTVILLAMLFMPLFYKKVVRNNKLFLLFVCLFSFFLLFESMFNRQWGIMFFLLFYNTILLNKGNSVSLESA
jgi:O-antigen ligase